MAPFKTTEEYEDFSLFLVVCLFSFVAVLMSSSHPSPDDADEQLASLVAAASIATPSSGASRSTGSALGGDSGQISFEPTITSHSTVQDRSFNAMDFSTSDPTPTLGSGRSSTSKFGIAILRTHDSEIKSLCLGIKRGGTTFCIDPKCSKAGDHGTGLPPQSLGKVGGVFMMKNAASAFCTPIVPLEHLSEDTLAEIGNQKHTMEEWMKKFVAITRLHQLQKEGNADASLKETENKISTVEAIKTPFTLKTSKSTTASFLFRNFSPHRTILQGEMTEVMKKINEDSTMIPTVLREVEDSVMEAGDLIKTLHSNHEQTSKENSDALEALGLRFEQLSMEIGPREKLPDDYQAPTLWGIISSMIQAIDDKSELKPSSLQEHSLEQRVSTLESSLGTSLAHVRDFKTDTMSKLSSARTEAREGIDKLRAHFMTGFKALMDRLSSVEQDNATMEGKVHRLERTTMHSLSGNANVPSTAGVDNRILQLQSELASMKQTLQDSQVTLKRLQSNLDSTTIKFGNLGLSSVDDCKAWISLKFGSRAYGLLFDVNLVLEWCAPQENGDVLSMLTTMEKRHKMQIATTNEARALFAMKNEFPTLLYKDFPSTGKDPSFLTAMKDHGDWESPETGVRDGIVNRLASMVSMFGEQIATTMEHEPEARALALSMLSVSVTCCRELVTYFDDTMSELTLKSKFTTKKAFSLVTQVVRRFFMDLYKVRAQVYSSLSTADNTGQCAWILYGVLRSHDVMSEYTKARFKNHPSVSSEYIRFLSTNSGFESLKTLEDRVDELKRVSVQTVKDCTAAKKAADTASSVVDSVKKDVGELKKQAKRHGGGSANNNND